MPAPTPTVPQPDPDSLQSSMRRNIEAIAQRRREEENNVTPGERVARSITFFTGSLGFVALHLLLYAGWAAVNLDWVPRLPASTPTSTGSACSPRWRRSSCPPSS